MKFRLTTIAYVFALLAAALATFGDWGIVVGLLIATFWGCLFTKGNRPIAFWLCATVLTGVVATILLPADTRSRPVASLNSCLNNLKQISLALENYRQHHGKYPPAFIADADGKPMHSWRVLILPFMEQQTLYDSYDLNEPWDGPNNRQLWKCMPEVYACPSRLDKRYSTRMPADASSYVAIVGDETAWPNDRAVDQTEITDDLSETMFVMESSRSTLPWTAPVDLHVSEAMTMLTADAPHSHVTVVDSWLTSTLSHQFVTAAHGNGHAEWHVAGMKEEYARSLLTVAGGETFPTNYSLIRPDYTTWNETTVRYERVYALVAVVGLALLPGWRRLIRNRQRGTVSVDDHRK